jgi:pimeloyl-ACP methyl ester carboxylesterase
MPWITASDGVELYYEEEGSGFPLVFTHGMGGYGHSYYLQIRILSKKYRCIMHDLRGLGLSGKPEAEIYDTKIQASDLHTILAELGIKRAVHLGHSYGGVITLQYYFDYPDETEAIVLIDSYHDGGQLGATEDQLMDDFSTLQGRQMIFTTLVTSEKFTKYNPYADEIRATIWKEATKSPIYAIKAIGRGVQRAKFTDRLSEVKVPCLVIHAEEDKAAPYDITGKVLAERIPGARFELVKDAGHFCFMEKPEIINEILWNWLEEKIKP